MARTALWGPAHRVMQRMPIGSLGVPFNAAPSLDMGGSGMQDTRLLWNTANSKTGAQVIGWMGAGHPFLDFVPSTLSAVALAAAQVPVSGTPLTLVSSSGAGITVSTTPTLMFPSLVTLPTGTLFIDGIPAPKVFGAGGDATALYDAALMGARCLTITSVGNDSGAVLNLVGFDAYGYPLHQTITMGNAGAVTTLKAFKGLISATPVGTLSGSNVSIGQSDTYGMPIFCSSAATTVTGFWNNLIITGAGTVTSGVTTSPATALTGDVRGTYLVGSASNNTKRLTVYQHPVLSNMVTNITTGVFGVPQF
jgi:hypothetical protein